MLRLMKMENSNIFTSFDPLIKWFQSMKKYLFRRPKKIFIRTDNLFIKVLINSAKKEKKNKLFSGNFFLFPRHKVYRNIDTCLKI